MEQQARPQIEILGNEKVFDGATLGNYYVYTKIVKKSKKTNNWKSFIILKDKKGKETEKLIAICNNTTDAVLIMQSVLTRVLDLYSEKVAKDVFNTMG